MHEFPVWVSKSSYAYVCKESNINEIAEYHFETD